MRTRPLKKLADAFTLAEVVVAIFIAALVFGGIIVSYSLAVRRAQWSGYQLAAQGLAVEQMEVFRSAVWNPAANGGNGENQLLQYMSNNVINGTDFTTNAQAGNPGWRGYLTNILNMPITTNGGVLATNWITVTTNSIPGYPGIQFMVVRVDTVWPFCWTTMGTNYYTNTLVNYFGPYAPGMNAIITNNPTP
jgi:hypothetical protein